MWMRELTTEQMREIYENHMKKDFPPAELKPLQRILDMREQGICKAFGWWSETELLGYAILVQPEAKEPFGKDSYILMDYYAVCRGHRGTGVGTEFLTTLLQSQDCRGILFEVDDPEYADDAAEREIRERRVRFYERIGCRMTEGLRANVFTVDFRLMVWNRAQEAITPNEMEDAMSRVYRRMLSEKLFEKNVHFSQK